TTLGSVAGRESAAEEPAGRDTGELFAVATRGLAVDPHVLDAGAVHDETVGAARLVVHPLDRQDADRLGIERDEVRVEALLDEPALRDPEGLVRMAREAPHRSFESDRAL